MQRSNLYIIGFSVALTVVLGGALALASVGLAPIQKREVELDKKSQILGAVLPVRKGQDDIIGIYNERIRGLVVDIEGNEVTQDAAGNPIAADMIDVAAEYKKAPEKRLYPVFKLMAETEPDKIESYIMPVFGNGLWDRIWGFVALEEDLNTVRGVVFDHKGETPGLGARISEKLFQERFEGKRFYSDAGEFIAIKVAKAETNNPDQYDEYSVDGLSGATITANGVTNMMKNYLGHYSKYIERVQAEGAVRQVTEEASPAVTDDPGARIIGSQDTTSGDAIMNKNNN